ncbi:MarR family transcriptional regulator [Tetzosporium hominis]|uniref:MarR family transcriptional regulator n=2 Tax=Caryophanaceae TaxID=186818 RepID=A0A264VZW6_9BACL|nr:MULTISPECIES: MarR family transcriptional regulator [Planococcaceae]OZS76878.1 MarR family transcriptional regulator [Tetzosporium hominis]PJK16486.1 MarR family transcriptional regulator [Chryseomicrobium excrementi]
MTEILREIGMIARALDSISNIEFKEFDLAKGHYLYLVRICEQPGIIQEKVAEQIKVDRTTAARAIQKLELNGLIEKRVGKSNRKNKYLYPTAKGLEIYPNILKEHKYSEEVALNGLNADEAKLLEKMLVKVRGNIEKDWETVKKGNKRIY